MFGAQVSVSFIVVQAHVSTYYYQSFSCIIDLFGWVDKRHGCACHSSELATMTSPLSTSGYLIMIARFQSATMTTEYRKVYIPLESNPEVFTKLIHTLGVNENVVVQDVFSLDDPDLVALTPRPVYALIFTLIGTEKYIKWKQEDERDRPVYNGRGEGEEVVWFEQTIHNACGFYGILHSISNGSAVDHIRK